LLAVLLLSFYKKVYRLGGTRRHGCGSSSLGITARRQWRCWLGSLSLWDEHGMTVMARPGDELEVVRRWRKRRRGMVNREHGLNAGVDR
jgi:hypothetical protein